ARSGAAPAIDFFNPIYGRQIALPPVITSQVQNQDQIGFYLQDQVKWRNWSLLAGLRGDLAGRSIENRLTNVTTQECDGAVTGRVGLVYQFDVGLAPYISYAESFQPTAGTTFAGAPFEPTTGTQYELGVKYQPPGYNSMLTAALYDLTQQNVLTPDPARPL